MTGNLWILLAAGGAVVAVFVALSRLAGGQEPAGSPGLGAGQPRRKKRRYHGAGGQR